MINFIKNIIARYKFAKEVRNHIQSSPYRDTLYSPNWIIHNHKNLMGLLPDVWTHINNIDYLVFGIKLKMLGVDWESKDDLKEILAFFETLNLIHVKNGGYQIIRNENSQFGDAYQRLQDNQ